MTNGEHHGAWTHRIRARAGAGLLILLSLAVFGLVLSQLDAESFWYDEAWSWTAAHTWLDADPMVPIKVFYDSHPPTYYRLVSIWMGWFGASEFAVRFLSAVFFLLTIPVVYSIGRVLHSHGAGLYAATLCLTSGLLFGQAQEARSYALLLFVCSVMFLCLAHIVCRRHMAHYVGSSMAAWASSREKLVLDAAWVGLGISVLAAMCIHYVALSLPLLVGAILLGTALTGGTARKHMMVNAVVVGAVVLALWVALPYGLLSFLSGRKGAHDPDLWNMLRALWRLYGTQGYFHWGAVLTGGLAMVGALGCYRRGLKPQAALLIAGWLFIPAVAVLITMTIQPVFVGRMFAWTLVPFFLLVGIGLCHFGWKLAVPLFAVLLLLQVYGMAEQVNTSKPPWETVSMELQSNVREDDVILACPPWRAVALNPYYGTYPEPRAAVPDWSGRDQHWLAGPAARHERVWLVTTASSGCRDEISILSAYWSHVFHEQTVGFGKPRLYEQIVDVLSGREIAGHRGKQTIYGLRQ